MGWIEAGSYEIRIALRSLRRSPGFSIITILVLAVAIGAATAVFSIVDDLLLQPPAYRDPSRVVLLWKVENGERRRFTAYDFLQLRAEARSFASLAAFGSTRLDLTGSGEPESLTGARITGEYFEVLGVRPLHGRSITNTDVAGDSNVVVLGHDVWLRRFAGSAAIVGKTIRLNDLPYTVIGVLAPGVYPTWANTSGRDVFAPSSQDFLVPARFDPKYTKRAGVLCVLGRLKGDASPAAASTEVGAILAAIHPDENPKATVMPVVEELTGDIRAPLLLLFGTVAIVMVIATANVIALFVVRVLGRRRSFAVMLATGASRWRVALRVLAESLVIGIAAGILGLLISTFFVKGIVMFVPREVPRLGSVAIDARVLAFAFGVSILTALACGLFPGMHAARHTSTAALRSESRSSGGTASRSARRVLAVVQIALALVLAIASGLLARSYRRAVAADRGFDAAHVVMADLSLPSSRYREAHQVTAFTGTLLEELARLPGVRDASVSYESPLHGMWMNSFEIVGQTGNSAPTGRFCPVTPGFFRTLGVELVKGRDFGPSDRPGGKGTVIINETLARRYFPGVEPLHQRLVISPPSAIWGESMPEEFEVVGVVEDVTLLAKDVAGDAMFFTPWAQGPLTDLTVSVRTTNEALVVRSLPTIVHRLDRNLPVGTISTLDQQIAESLGATRFVAVLVSAFGAIALLLAMTGIYGLLAENVLQQTRALGIRMAFGARASDVFRLIVGEGMALFAAGALIGGLASWALARVLRHAIEGIDISDSVAYVQVFIVLLAATVVASVIPALRAIRIHITDALRHD